MVDISDNLGYVPVVRVEPTDLVGPGGNETNQPNKAYKELASRDAAILELLGGTDATAQATAAAFQQLGIASTAQGRLTLESGVPISSTDQLAATTLYYTPYNGDRIALYDTGNSRWDLRQFTERSIALSGTSSTTVYDIFAYWDGDSVELELVGWSSGTVRATNITQLDGIWVKSADNRRYIGTINVEVAGQSEDSEAKRYLFNANNRAPRIFRKDVENTPYLYSSTAFRPSSQGSLIAARAVIVAGLPNVSIQAIASMACSSEDNQLLNCPSGGVGIGLNQSTSNNGSSTDRPATADRLALISIGTFTLREGFNFVVILESGFNGNGTVTGDFEVDAGVISGIVEL